MKKKKLFAILSVLAVLTLLVAACTTEPEEPEVMDDPAIEEEITDSEMENNDDMDDSSDSTDSSDDESSSDAGEGSDQSEGADGSTDQETELTDEEMLGFLEEKLDGEHSVDFIFSQDKTYEEWVQTFENHINYGLELSEDARDMLINWLIGRKDSADEGAMAEEEMAMTDEEMIALIESKIEGQHTLSFLLGQDKTYDEWVVTIDRMIGYGADVNEEEKELIINWLLEQ